MTKNRSNQMETKIAEKINNEITPSPFPVYRMIPEFHGASIIAVTTIEKFAQVLELYNQTDEFKEFLDKNPDKSKVLLFPGVELPIGIAINQGLGALLDHSFEIEMLNEGYLIVE